MKKTEDNPWELPFPRPETLHFQSPKQTKSSRAIFNLAKVVRDDQVDISSAEFEQLVAAIDPARFDWQTRRCAAWTLGQVKLDPARAKLAAETLLLTVSGPNQAFRRITKRVLRCLLFCSPALMLGPVAVGWTDFIQDWTLWVGAVFVWFLAAGVVLVPYIPMVLASDYRHSDLINAECVRALARLRIPDTVPDVLEALAHAGRQTREAANHELVALLESITADHYGKIPRLTNCLCNEFFWAGVDLKRAILSALGRAGDGWAAHRLYQAWRSQPIEVRGWIEETLLILSERRKSERHAERLLRPADVPEPENLLRPATGEETAHELLLRPATND
jgi:hypothetical protein